MSNREVDHALENAMTVRHLVTQFVGCDVDDDDWLIDPDANIFFVCGYGDHSNTQQALPVAEATDAESSDLAETAYSQSNVCLRENTGDDPGFPREDDESFPIIVLRS
jgi:hypothetical protein